MRKSRFGGFLLATGAAVGVAAVVGIMTGFDPAKLPPALLTIAAYKLAFAAAAGLLAAGAIVRRHANRAEADPERAVSPELGPQSVPQIGEARVDDYAPRKSTPVRVPKDR
jgi:hypothetical protein